MNRYPLIVSQAHFDRQMQHPPWNIVEQVAISFQDLEECPICLSFPQGPRITLCGHIFCLECLLAHTQNLEHPSSAKCPICQSILLAREARPVYLFVDPIAVPSANDSTGPISLTLLIKVGDRVQPIELMEAMGEMEDYSVHSPLLPFLSVAYVETEELVSSLQLEASQCTCQKSRTFIEGTLKRINASVDTVTNCTEHPNTNISDQATWFFYGGRHATEFFTLSTQAVKKLLQEYGAYSAFPRQINAFCSSSRCLVDEAFKKRYKYLQHLPIGTTVVWCTLVEEESIEKGNEKSTESQSSILQEHEQMLYSLTGWTLNSEVVNLQDEQEFPGL